MVTNRSRASLEGDVILGFRFFCFVLSFHGELNIECAAVYHTTRFENTKTRRRLRPLRVKLLKSDFKANHFLNRSMILKYSSIAQR